MALVIAGAVSKSGWSPPRANAWRGQLDSRPRAVYSDCLARVGSWRTGSRPARQVLHKFKQVDWKVRWYALFICLDVFGFNNSWKKVKLSHLYWKKILYSMLLNLFRLLAVCLCCSLPLLVCLSQWLFYTLLLNMMHEPVKPPEPQIETWLSNRLTGSSFWRKPH